MDVEELYSQTLGRARQERDLLRLMVRGLPWYGLVEAKESIRLSTLLAQWHWAMTVRRHRGEIV